MKLLFGCTMVFMVSMSCKGPKNLSAHQENQLTGTTITVPLGGNSWAQNGNGKSGHITKAGIENWTNEKKQFDTYFRINEPGTVKISVRAKTDGESTLKLTVGNTDHLIKITGESFRFFDAGEWNIKDTGYQKISLSGISKTGKIFAELAIMRLVD